VIVRPSCGRRWAVVLRHRQPGQPAHSDVLIAGVPRCATLQISRAGGTWRGRWIAAHRRRYLHVHGPVPGGRGRIARRWSGWALVRRWHGGFALTLAHARCHLTADGRIVPRAAVPKLLRT
jgi:hypothetical protein